MTSSDIVERAGRPNGRPARVVWALIALWAAWVVSAVALGVNQFVFHGSGIGPGLSLGIVALAAQAIMLWFVARGSPVARALTVVFLALATLTLQILGRLIAEGSVWSASYTAAGFALKAIGVYLLFTGDSRKWFATR